MDRLDFEGLKSGDIVRVKNEIEVKSERFNERMKRLCGREVTITFVRKDNPLGDPYIRLLEDDGRWYWYPEFIELIECEDFDTDSSAIDILIEEYINKI